MGRFDGGARQGALMGGAQPDAVERPEAIGQGGHGISFTVQDTVVTVAG